MKQQSAALLDSDQKGFWGNQYWTYLSGLRRRGFHLGFLSFALAAVLLSQNWGSPRTIIIEVDGQVYSFTTPQRRVSAILREAGINLRPEDQPTPNRNELVLEGEKISLTQAIPVVVDVDGKVERFYTAADTIGQVLAEAKIGLSRYDKVMDGARKVSSQEPFRSLATIANGGPPPGNGLGKGSSVEVKQVATSGDIGYLQPRYPPREIAVLRAVPITITDNGLAIMS